MSKKKETAGLSKLALIFGCLTWLPLVSVFFARDIMTFNVVVGWLTVLAVLFGITSLILGIVALAKKTSKKAWAILGIVFGAVVPLIVGTATAVIVQLYFYSH